MLSALYSVPFIAHYRVYIIEYFAGNVPQTLRLQE